MPRAETAPATRSNASRPEARTVLERFGILDTPGRENLLEHSKCGTASIEDPTRVEHDALSQPELREGEAPAAGR